MELDKYQRAWQTDAAQTRVTIHADQLLKEVQRSHGDFRSTIFWRDFREVAVALVLLPFWFLMGLMLSLPWTWYLTVPALVWVAAFMLVDRRRHPQRPSEPGEPLLHYVKQSLTQVEHQIWLLRNVFWWYLLPFSISILAFLLHVAWQSTNVWWQFVVTATFSLLFLVMVYGSIYRLNQRAVRVQLEPRRQELTKLIASLEDESTSESSHDIVDVVTALAVPALNQGWAQNWNLMIPSWREAATIILATLGGAFCGLWSPIDDLGPVFFQAVVGAVVAFEIALGCTWLRFRKKQKQSLSAKGESKALASGVDQDNSANQKPQLLPRAPALLIIVLTVFLSILAFFVLYLFVKDSQRGHGSVDHRGPELTESMVTI